jgi:hypothetical protein
MYDIKYFFLNKNNKTIQRGQKNKFQGDKLSKALLKNTIFSQSRKTPTTKGVQTDHFNWF